MSFTWKKNLLFLGLILLFFIAWAVFTDAVSSIKDLKLEFVLLAVFFFMASVFTWVFSWALFVKKQVKASFPVLFLVGFASLMGSITPIQSGSDALRSFFLKKQFDLSVSSSLQSSFIVKGLKFSMIFLFSCLLVVFFIATFVLSREWFSLAQYFAAVVYFVHYLQASKHLLLLFFFLSGLLVVFSGSVLFLLPLKKGFSSKVGVFFSRFEKKHFIFSKLKNFFEKYPSFLSGTSFNEILFVAALSFLSLVCEFLAMVFSFYSVGAVLSPASLFVFFILFSILERTPVLPRGVGIAEVTGYYFLSFPFFSSADLSGERIGAMLLVYGVVRLVIPTVVGFVSWAIMAAKFYAKKEK